MSFGPNGIESPLEHPFLVVLEATRSSESMHQQPGYVIDIRIPALQNLGGRSGTMPLRIISEIKLQDVDLSDAHTFTNEDAVGKWILFVEHDAL